MHVDPSGIIFFHNRHFFPHRRSWEPWKALLLGKATEIEVV
jgi:hypothetical protein